LNRFLDGKYKHTFLLLQYFKISGLKRPKSKKKFTIFVGMKPARIEPAPTKALRTTLTPDDDPEPRFTFLIVIFNAYKFYFYFIIAESFLVFIVRLSSK